MPAPERTLPPAPAPPHLSLREVTAFTIAALTDQGADHEHGPDLMRARIRKVVYRRVIAEGGLHRRQLEAWCRAQAFPGDRDLSFRRVCDGWGWSRTTAQRNVNEALAQVAMMLNLRDDGRF